MLPTNAVKRSPETVLPDQPALSAEEKQALLNQAILKMEKLAESQLEMAQWFLAQGHSDVARRRLIQIVSEYQESTAAACARELLRGL